MLDAGYSMLDAGYSMLDAGYSILDITGVCSKELKHLCPHLLQFFFENNISFSFISPN
jgi:hypothetical protein